MKNGMLETYCEVNPDNEPPKLVRCTIDLTDVEFIRQSAENENRTMCYFRSGGTICLDEHIEKMQDLMRQ